MYVQNYVPDPLEVPGNVTEQPYLIRLTYIRKVSLLHATSFGLIALLAQLQLIAISPSSALLSYAILMVVLCLLRIAFRGKKEDIRYSIAFVPVLLIGASVLTSSLLRSGFPVWSAALGLSCALVYALLCGRDFSFVGQFLLSLIASSALIALVVVILRLGKLDGAQALAWNAAYLSFYVYDLASLLARRRVGEELAAVVDLYRDVLNVFGWVVRVLSHWKKHKIWSLPARWS